MIDYIAVWVGYVIMTAGAMLTLSYMLLFLVKMGNKVHWAIADHIGGYKLLMEFKKWKEDNDLKQN